MLFKYCTGRCRQRVRSVPSFLVSGIAELYIGARSVLITRGWGWDRSLSALRNRRLAASASRNARQQEIDGGSPGIDGPIQIAPPTLHTDVGFVDSARLVCRLEMPSQSLLQLRAVILHPAPDRGVIDIETALLQQLLNIAQRQRIAKIPPDRTKYEAGFGLPPFEDRGSGYHFAILSRHQPAALKVATHPIFAHHRGVWNVSRISGAPMVAKRWGSVRSEQQRVSSQLFRPLLGANLRGGDRLYSPVPRKADTHVPELTPRSIRASFCRASRLKHSQFCVAW